jgi:putative tricarboxylic transport membrane protein
MITEGGVNLGEFIFLGVLAIIAIALFIQTLSFPNTMFDRSGGAALVPRILIVGLLIFIVFRVISIFLSKKREPFVFTEIFKGTRLFYLISLTLYVILIKPVGYIITTSIFLIVVSNYMSYKTNGKWDSPAKIITRSTLMIVGTVGLYLFFATALKVVLPSGILGF